MIALACGAVMIATAVPAEAEAPEDRASPQAAAADRLAAELAARVEKAESEHVAANERWQSLTRAVSQAQHDADEAEHGADVATRNAGAVARQAYRGGMVDDLLPLIAIVDPAGSQLDLRAVASLAQVADHTGQKAITKQVRATDLNRRARRTRAELAAVRAALDDATARLAAVRAEEAGAQLRASAAPSVLDPRAVQRNVVAHAAWWDFLDLSKLARVPTFTAAQLRSGKLPRGIVRAKGAPGVARFRAGKKWLAALPNETVEAISYSVGALGTSYFWQADMGTDCVRLTSTAWKQEAGEDLAQLATLTPLRPAKAVHPGDQVFLANDEHGLYQTGIALDDARMIAADAASWAVNVVPIVKGDVWRVARPGAAGRLNNRIPQGDDPWRCGANPLGQLGQLSGTPRQIIEQSVLPWAMEHGFPDATPANVLAANQRHGPTIGGSRSDHQGPGEYSWAADISNGGSPTPEMDKLAQTLATAYGLPWTGSGVTQIEKDGYTVQMLYRTTVGGNHFNHVHIAVRRTDLTPVPEPQF